MKPDARISIVYSTFGDGHLKVAQALKHSFESSGFRNVRMFDWLAETHPRINSISRFVYLKSAMYTPRLYGLIYRWTNRRPSRLTSHLFHSFGLRRMKKQWESERPDLIIHTFPLLTADELRYKIRHEVPTVTVITDYVLHSRWLHANTSLYFVGSEALKKEMTIAGVPEANIAVTGIPLHETFHQSWDREDLCCQHDYAADRSRVLVMAGAYGVQSSVRKLIATVLMSTDSDVIVVCGRNSKLKSLMDTDFSGNERVRVTGYVNHVRELMAISDCLLTKAGGVTLTEAMAMALPTIVFRPLPGQEQGNADYLAAMGAIGIAYRTEELARQLRMALSESGAARMRKSMSGLYRRQDAVQTISEKLQSDLDLRPDRLRSLRR